MMVQLGGQERTEEQYRDLLEASGLQFTGAKSGGLFGILEARPG